MFETNSKKRLESSGGMFGYDSITVSYAWELISVSTCYSQGDGFNTLLSRLCTVLMRPYLSCLTVLLACSVYCVGCSCRWHGHVLLATTVTKIMCVHLLYQQG